MRALCAGCALAVALLAVSAARADLYDSDPDLIAHILSTDHVFSRVLSRCRSERIERDTRDGLAWFSYSAICSAPPAEDDCASYQVNADGTIDRFDLATVRDLRMVLQCSR
jgi:hypothetical protein